MGVVGAAHSSGEDGRPTSRTLASEILERLAYLFFIALLNLMPHPETLS